MPEGTVIVPVFTKPKKGVKAVSLQSFCFPPLFDLRYVKQHMHYFAYFLCHFQVSVHFLVL